MPLQVLSTLTRGWDPELVSRLFCEARAVAQIADEHLVDVYDFVADPQRGVVAYIMEYLAGEDLIHITCLNIAAVLMN